MRERTESFLGWLIIVGIVVVVGASIWFTYFGSDAEPPSYVERQASVAASQTCDELKTAHFAALDAHEVEAIGEQQMDSLWRGVLDKAEVIQPGASLTTHLRCTGLIGTCPRGTPADICADLLSEDFQP